MEKIGKASIDDIVKEHVLNGLPVDVKRQLANRVDTMTAKEVADMADNYFDKDGRILHSSSATDVNHVHSAPTGSVHRVQASQETNCSAAAYGDLRPPPTQPSFTAPFSSQDDSDVNAVRFRQGQRQNVNVANRTAGSYSRGRGQNRGNSTRGGNSNSRYATASSSSTSSTSKVCSYHVRFGEQAQKCEQGCMLYAQHQKKAPNGKPTNPRM